MALSRPLQVALALAGLLFVTWVVGVVLQLDVVGLVLIALFMGVVISVAIELCRNDSTWVRAIGVLLIVGVVLAILFIAFVIALGSALCDSACD